MSALSAWLAAHPLSTGQEVLLLKENRGANRPPQTYRTSVTAVGRQYVKTGMFSLRFQCLDPDAPYLSEADSVGLAEKLFPDQASLDEYLKREDLAAVFRRMSGRWAENCTAGQLRAAMDILDGKDGAHGG